MPKSQKCFTPEFREEAVRLIATSSQTWRAIAEDLGVGLSTLRNWIDRQRAHQIEHPPTDRQDDLAAELKRPRRKEILRQERDILKRATAFFATSISLNLIDVAKTEFPV